MPRHDLELVPARSLPLPELAALFNAAYRDYPIPLALDESALQRHLADNDIDLELSLVARAPEPVAFALIGRRRREAWVGGMGTIPEYRRHGFAERTLDAALRAAAHDGAEVAWLEVLEQNRGAISLYGRLGFEVTRRLIVCWLRELGAPEGDWRTMKVEDARRWIADRRPSGEPWQRDDPVLARTSDSERPLAAIGIPDSGPLAAALVYAPGTSGTSIMQMVARDGSAAAEGLRAAATAARSPIVLVNFPDDEPIAAGLTALGIRPDHVQLEMQLRLADD